MKRLTLDELRAALPDIAELRPILDDLVSRSEPDDARLWAGSGQLGTVGSRLMPTGDVAEDVAALAHEESEHLGTIYRLVGQALASLASEDTIGAARLYLEAAASEEARDRPERASAFAEAAYRAVEAERDRTVAALALRRSARALRSLGKLEEALRRYRRSHDMALGMSDHRGAAEAAIGAGNVLEEQGRWDEAESWYRSALQRIEQIDGPAPERWHALVNLHIVARWRGALEESESLLREAEQAAGETDPDAATPFIENARGQLLTARGAYGEAEKAFRVALAAAPHARARVTIRLNLAESYLAAGRLLEAAENAREAEVEAIRGRTVSRLPEVYRILGRVASAEKNADAFVLFERALKIARERDLPALEEALTMQAYAESEARTGELDAARELREGARERLATLGITQERRLWADVFGPADDHEPPAGE